MRILFVSRSFPSDLITDRHGVYKRMEMLIDAIKEIAELDILYYVPPDTDVSPEAIAQKEYELSQHWHTKIKLFLCPQFRYPESLPKWQRQWGGIFNFSKQLAFVETSGVNQIHAFEQCLSRKPDAIFAHKLNSMTPAILTTKTLPPIFFDVDDIEHIKYLRWLKQPPIQLKKLLYSLQFPALWWGELVAIRLAKRTFICSELDRDYLYRQWNLSGITVVQNAVAIPSTQPITPNPNLLFLGSYCYLPNVNAANFLIEQVWLRIYQSMPEAKLIIAGREPERIRSYIKDVPGVEFTGFVEDLDTLYQRSRVVCCPIFSGGGTRIKMVEAAAYGKPIVATRIGVEGLEMSDGQEFLLRNNPIEFAEACLELLRNNVLCEKLGSAARACAIEYYDRASIVKFIQNHIKEVTDATTNSQDYAYN